MERVLIIGGHGMGDCLMAFQCAKIVEEHGVRYKLLISARDEVYKPLFKLFGNHFIMEQIHESYAADNTILKDESLMKTVSTGYNEVYYVIPDLLFNNKYSFPYKQYSTNPQMIRSKRLLDTQADKRGFIYLGLMTTTDGYMYSEPLTLALNLAYSLPSNIIYFPIVKHWANKEIKTIDIPNKLPANLVIEYPEDLEEGLIMLSKSSYFVGTDNGPSHVAYHMGVPRLLLDPQFGKLPWIARWREDYLESIPISSSVEDIVNVVKTNLEIPQTTLVPRMTCLVNKEANWQQLLWLKSE